MKTINQDGAVAAVFEMSFQELPLVRRYVVVDVIRDLSTYILAV